MASTPMTAVMVPSAADSGARTTPRERVCTAALTERASSLERRDSHCVWRVYPSAGDVVS